jgi:acyl-coenzyme A synthetase/AMP-(fatty) acid ligase
MKPADLGTHFDTLAEQHSGTVVHLSRPFDIAPHSAIRYDIGQLAQLIRETAGWLAAAGARPGDTVAVAKPNHWDYALLACATARLGAVPALLSDHLAPDALQTLLKRLNPAVLVTDARTLEAARSAQSDPAAFARRTITLSGTAAGATPLDEVRGAAPPPRRRPVDRTLVITHTSGTTGLPKLVEHTTTTIIQHLAGFESTRMPVITSRRSDTVANANPFCHGRTIPWTVSVFHLRPRKVVIVADSDPATA